MAREPFEKLPAWRAAMHLAQLAHHVAAELPADEKSGMAAAIKRAALGVAVKVAESDAAETPDAAVKVLNGCEPAMRELLTTALLAYQLGMLRRPQLRKLRGQVDRVRGMIDAELAAWDRCRTEDLEAAEAQITDDVVTPGLKLVRRAA